MTALVGWLVGCSADTDSPGPATGVDAVQFTGIDAVEITDVVLLLFDRDETLSGIIHPTGDRLDGNSLSLGKHIEGVSFFAAVNTDGQYILTPSNLQPGITKAANISFEAIGNARANGEENNPLCGSAGKGNGTVNIKLKPMNGVSISIQSWIVREAIPQF